MDDRSFEAPILNSPYEYPSQHWELDEQGQPTQRITESQMLMGNYNAVKKGKVDKRVDRRVAGKATGKAIGQKKGKPSRTGPTVP